ncbi:uncharacterized protein LOC123010292 isoform X2 [Tribolium madens]|uniref:uncharacterized protein LOC123010292 isoform X2 n=1 Tax=Tribolium madens TaxID=41895 RepID=UPI001CF75A14|nr:uncharacterized protein LOC123010292 isoform X2 [Tribolium madens]
MSDNIPPTTLPRKRSRRKYDKTKLPTPPPDPTEKESERDDFLAYLDSLQKANLYSRSTSTFAPIMVTEDAFDHLEKLYKLMEQMLELREQNARLHRRIRDLEHLNNLEKMRKELDVRDDCPELDKDTAFAETILESILSETKSPKQKISAPSRLRQSISRKGRNRSGSVTVTGLEPEVRSDRRASTCVDSRAKPAKVSKWTKVKAAFKWEKAAPNVSDAKSQDSGIGGMAPVEVARYLRVPSCDDHGHSPVDSGAAEVSTPASLSTASSTEDFHRHDQRSPCEDFRSSDDEHSHNYIPHSKEGSQKSHKCHKTPWAKMKDIIQTRNSFKKKHRLSAHSDDIQIDVELCSDNEDNVFEDEDKKSPKIYKRLVSNDLPPEIVARYQQAIAEDSDSKKVSKWTRVKKAFLPPHDNPQNSKEDTVEDEIQRNYKQLQKKLSLEFQEKLTEWERMKQSSPGITNPSSSCGYVDEPKDSAFMKKMEEWQKIKSQPSVKRSIQMTSEENLPPEFRKKLQEWEKIRKLSGKESPKKKLSEVPRWKSLSAPKSETSPTIEYPPLSEDFRKKLEEWKQIKSGATTEFKSSPKLNRKESSPKHSKKHKEPHDKELQWFEKELGKIEKEKQRLERERQKFLEREESLSKLRSSVLGGLKKEVLIHTPSGFYRFEGISRKFTQKLYEWEKAQGIGPESSTFALLNSSLNRKTSPKHKTPDRTPPLVRSKSADSIAITCPLMSHQPSSLSLNDVEELEKEVLAESKSSSIQFIEDEPEALIVEVEDIVEETAAPLPTYSQRIQQPVYQREELKTMCEGETCAAPKVRRSESAKAQNNYNLIEEIFSILKNLIENELEIQRTQEVMSEQAMKVNSDLIRLKMFDESQKAMSNRLNDKILHLQEANSSVFAGITSDESEMKQVVDTLETVQDLSSEINQLTERLDIELNNRNVYEAFRDCGARSLNPIIETAKDINSKMLELRRRLSYICAASDLTAPRRKFSNGKKKTVKKTTSIESNAGSEGRLYVKSDTCNTQSQGAIKKRIRYRQKSQQNRNFTDTDDEEEEMQKNTHKKLTRTRSVSESSTTMNKEQIPTQTNFLNISSLNEETKPSDSPVTVFVKTTRKLFTPLVESGLSREFDEAPPEAKNQDISRERSLTQLPPLPTSVSPAPQRKLLKDISPSIKIMMDKYNQKISESPSTKSGKSSGSASPVAWRSPIAERRVKAQTERYQEELKKASPVQKSASASFLHRQVTMPKSASSCISKSSSVATFARNEEVDAKRLSTELRLQKLQKAKEEFLNAGPASTPSQSEEPIKFPTRNRLSQISVDSESSYESACGALIKSASAGMINVDALVYKQIDPEIHGGGYVSLPRNTNKQKGLLGGKFGFSNIASKFRKVKMRRGKDAGKMNTVSTLCRQSLVVDIQPQLAEQKNEEETSQETSPGSSRNNSWIKKTKLFKK